MRATWELDVRRCGRRACGRLRADHRRSSFKSLMRLPRAEHLEDRVKGVGAESVTARRRSGGEEDSALAIRLAETAGWPESSAPRRARHRYDQGAQGRGFGLPACKWNRHFYAEIRIAWAIISKTELKSSKSLAYPSKLAVRSASASPIAPSELEPTISAG